jgi:hypothetical protein
MGEVIHVDFGALRDGKEVSGERYLRICCESLDENDYLDLLDAIQNPNFYQICDQDIQDLVDGYFVANTA